MAVIPKLQRSAFTILKRNIGFSAILAQKGQAVDPIQKLFVQKVREYDQKSKASPGKLVDSNPEIEKELKQELDRVAKMFGGGAGVDMTKFPVPNFQEPVLDPINQQAPK
ncbi:unnamed protein product [Orchesella dallaii]|uniref:ATP synthase-coupling factor 6, mitochondrial n=1 Tax=Orchesella dallaii TaxID=48710 RepID=A0ABP1QTC6_9HEXA